jgi:hypothetical protein
LVKNLEVIKLVSKKEFKFNQAIKKALCSCLAITFGIVAIAAWSYVRPKLNLKEDSVVEEVIEDIVEEKLDLPKGSFDLTPSSEE